MGGRGNWCSCMWSDQRRLGIVVRGAAFAGFPLRLGRKFPGELPANYVIEMILNKFLEYLSGPFR